MGVYLTSDLHLGHRLVSDLRGFTTIAQHDDAVLASITAPLTSADDLWILGDLSGGGRAAEDRALDLLAQVRVETGARLHLVEGNHDSVASIHRNGWKQQERFRAVFVSIQAFARRRGPYGTAVLFSHYPYQGDGPGRGDGRYRYARVPDTGAWLVHGHTHDSERRSGPREIHVGWDAWRRLVEWGEIEEIICGETEDSHARKL